MGKKVCNNFGHRCVTFGVLFAATGLVGKPLSTLTQEGGTWSMAFCNWRDLFFLGPLYPCFMDFCK